MGIFFFLFNLPMVIFSSKIQFWASFDVSEKILFLKGSINC